MINWKWFIDTKIIRNCNDISKFSQVYMPVFSAKKTKHSVTLNPHCCAFFNYLSCHYFIQQVLPVFTCKEAWKNCLCENPMEIVCLANLLMIHVMSEFFWWEIMLQNELVGKWWHYFSYTYNINQNVSYNTKSKHYFWKKSLFLSTKVSAITPYKYNK